MSLNFSLVAQQGKILHDRWLHCPQEEEEEEEEAPAAGGFNLQFRKST